MRYPTVEMGDSGQLYVYGYSTTRWVFYNMLNRYSINLVPILFYCPTKCRLKLANATYEMITQEMSL